MDKDKKELIEAVKRLQRWVGKGIADKLFENCTVAPNQAVHDLDFSEKVLNSIKEA